MAAVLYGILLSVFIMAQSNDFLKTIPLTAMSAAVSFGASYVLRTIIEKSKK